MSEVNNSFPDFYGIGVQKAGTTWLYAQLKKHPTIFMPHLKEIQYFNHLYIKEHRSWTDSHRLSKIKRMLLDELNREKVDYDLVEYLAKCAKNKLNDEWYGHFFSLARGRTIGEITPEYSLLPDEGIEHMLRLNPNSKFILLLRNPIERDFSHAKMILGNQGKIEKEDYNNNELEKELLKILDYRGVYERSDYKTIIERWKRVLTKEENLYIGFYDWIKDRPQQLLEEICGFIGCKYDEEFFQESDKVVFQGSSIEMTDTIRNKLLKRHQNTINYINNQYGDHYRIKWSDK